VIGVLEMKDMSQTSPGSVAILPFSRAEYEARWARVKAEMVRRGLGVAVVWGKTASSFDRAGDVLYLTHYFSTKVGQGFDAAPFSAGPFARSYCVRVRFQSWWPTIPIYAQTR